MFRKNRLRKKAQKTFLQKLAESNEIISDFYSWVDKNKRYFLKRDINTDTIIYVIFEVILLIFISSLAFTRSFIFAFVITIITCVVFALIIKEIVEDSKKNIIKNLPELIEVFINEISVYPNTKAALDSSYDKLYGSIKYAVLQLKIDMENIGVANAMDRFAGEYKDIFVQAFVELVKIYDKNGGDIISGLLSLLEQIDNHRKTEKERYAELSNVYITLPILSAFSLVGLIFNLIKLPSTKNIFFSTPQGRILFFIGLLMIVISLIVSFIMYMRNKAI